MANNLTPEQLTLVAAQEALRHGRQLLQNLTTLLIGVHSEPPSASTLMEVMTEMRAAEKQVADAILKTIETQRTKAHGAEL